MEYSVFENSDARVLSLKGQSIPLDIFVFYKYLIPKGIYKMKTSNPDTEPDKNVPLGT